MSRQIDELMPHNGYKQHGVGGVVALLRCEDVLERLELLEGGGGVGRSAKPDLWYLPQRLWSARRSRTSE